jgi:hypothetical protein
VARGRVQLPTFALGVRLNGFYSVSLDATQCAYYPNKH